MKCPYCNSDSMDKIEPEDGCAFVLEQVNKTTGKHNKTGKMISLYHCDKCYGVLTKIEPEP